MGNLVREEKYIKSDFANNNNKFWYISEYDDCSVVTNYGRVGKASQSSTKRFGSQDQASQFFNKKCSEKERNGRNGEIAYKKLKVVNGNGNSSAVVDNVSEIAKNQIVTDKDDEVLKLIDYFSKVNIHNIVQNTFITYNNDSGLFETPCGIVTQDAISEARILLDKIGGYVAKKKLDGKRYGRVLNEYLMLIPQDVGMKLNPSTLYTDIEDIRKQNDILDSLESSYQKVLSGDADDKKKDVVEDRIFSVKIKRVKDVSVIKRIRGKYKKTLDCHHVCAHLDLKRVYEVDIEGMSKKYETVGKKVGNIKELWHGTKASNILSILKQGLIVPPSNASYCTGRMFGSDGIYFANSSTKSLNYSYGYWSGGRYDKNCFMFLADTALGKCYYPHTYGGVSLPKGYDSLWAKSSNTGLRHDEFVVPVDQCKLTYLIEFA